MWGRPDPRRMVFPWVVRKKVFWKSISFGIKQIFFNIGMSLLSDLYTGDLSPNKKQVVQLNSLEPRKKTLLLSIIVFV